MAATTTKTTTTTLNSINLEVSERQHYRNRLTSSPSSANNNLVLLNKFEIFKTRYRAVFYSGILVWEQERTKKDKVTLPISDIICIKLQFNNANVSSPSTTTSTLSLATTATATTNNNNNNNNGIDTTPTATITKSTSLLSPTKTSDNNKSKYFTIHYGRNRNQQNKWSVQVVTMYNSDSRIVNLWYATIQNSINDLKYRPKNILLFINPFGGKQQAFNIYEKYCKPIFKLANIDVNVIVSQRPNQIRDILLTQALEHFDGIVCVGGDGTFSEVFNGLIYRTINDNGLDPLKPEYIPKPKLPIGIIPGGSTDTVAYSLHGTIDVATCVIHIALGQQNGLDLASVSNKFGLCRFYASVMSYGYLGDVALDSERFRWMGPKRYDYSGIKKFFANKGYDGEISILLDEAAADVCADEIVTDNNSIIVDNKEQCLNENDPAIGPGCYENCIRCTNATQRNSNKSVINFDSNKLEINDSYNFDRWKIIKGKFFMVNGANLSCACARSPNGFSKYCHIGDGYIDLVLIRHTSIINNLKLLWAMSSTNGKISELPFVEIYRTKKFSFCTQISTTPTTSIDSPMGSMPQQQQQQQQKQHNDRNTNADATGIDNDIEADADDDVDDDHNHNVINKSTQPINESVGQQSQQPQQPQQPQQHYSIWNCDGEIIQDNDITVRSHCQLINVYMRGRLQQRPRLNEGADGAGGVGGAGCCGNNDDEIITNSCFKCGFCNL